MKIILLGYMASGKSAVGHALAKVLDYQFIDLDDYIELAESASISDIFTSRGEVYFRKKEHDYLKAVLALSGNVVLSLGGGTPCYANNMDFIKSTQKTTSIYLHASIDTLVNRLGAEKEQRPLVKSIDDKAQLVEFIGKHLFERHPYYSLADYQIAVEGKSITDLTKAIVLKLYQ